MTSRVASKEQVIVSLPLFHGFQDSFLSCLAACGPLVVLFRSCIVGLFGCLVAWLVGRLVGWLAGW